MSNEIGAWVPDELPPPKKKASLTTEIRHIMPRVWESKYHRRLASSTRPENSVTGSPAYDRAILAQEIVKFASETSPGSSLATEENLTRVSHAWSYEANKLGVSRPQLKAAEAEYLAIHGSDESNTDESNTD